MKSRIYGLHSVCSFSISPFFRPTTPILHQLRVSYEPCRARPNARWEPAHIRAASGFDLYGDSRDRESLFARCMVNRHHQTKTTMPQKSRRSGSAAFDSIREREKTVDTIRNLSIRCFFIRYYLSTSHLALRFDPIL